MTPRSWEDWKARYESRGYRVLTPAYPGFEVEVEALNADPTPIEELTVPAVIEHLESVVRELDAPPILMGHSAGGVFTQQLMDRGYGAAGVAMNSAPTEGVKVVPLSQIKSTFPVLKNPANRHKAVGFTFEQWRYAFTNTFSEEEGRRLYERYHIPASGNVFWGSVLGHPPGHDDTYVDYKNSNRAPLLFISGSEDHLMPPSIQRSNAKHYKAEGTITEVASTRAARTSCPRRPAGRRSPTTPCRGRRSRPPCGRREAGRQRGRDRRCLGSLASWSQRARFCSSARSSSRTLGWLPRSRQARVDRVPGTLSWKFDSVTVWVPIGLMLPVSIVGTIVLNVFLRR